MTLRIIVIVAVVALFDPLLPGCFGCYTRSDNDVAVGEEHEVNFPDEETFVMTQDVFRGQGVLFNRKPEHKIITYGNPQINPKGHSQT